MKKVKIIIEKVKRKSVEMPRNLFLFKIGPVLRCFKKKPLPRGDKVLIHIGCGEFNDKTYINIDSRPGWHIDYVDSIENINNRFPENHADLIYACHVLEHVSHLKLQSTIQGLLRCLKPGGVLRLSVPNFETIVNMYNQRRSISDITPPLMGGQGYPGNFHASVFNETHLRNLLLQSGFTQVKKWSPENALHHTFKDWSGRKINLYGRDFPISLNLEGVK